MKKGLILSAAFVLAGWMTAFAKKETASVQVLGNCGMCKNRIEKAAKDAGATKAVWDSNTRQLSVTFKSGAVSLESIQQQIAAVGHDAGNVKATDESYQKLPGCCKYDRSGKPGASH